MTDTFDGGLDLQTLDRDGAIRETADRAGVSLDARISRRATLRTGGALIAGGMLAGAVPIALSGAQSGGLPKSDVAILNFALTLEFLEAAFYKEALAKGALSGELQAFAQTVSAHEDAHVAALQKTLGSAAIKSPRFDFKGTTASKAKFAKTAQALEDTGVSAYQGQAPLIKTPAVLMAAGSILPVEARHAAWIRDINGRGDAPSPARTAFSVPKSKSAVLAVVKATGFIKP